MAYCYEVQWRVVALAQIERGEVSDLSSFSADGVCFSHWESPFTFRESQWWLGRGVIYGSTLQDSLTGFWTKLVKLVTRISLISQCYIEFGSQPFLVKRSDKDFGYFRFSRDAESVPLLFGEKEKRALNLLLTNEEIPAAFYSYWNDAVNTIGYSSKLLNMFAAIETLVNSDIRSFRGKTKKDKRVSLLGAELEREIFGPSGRTRSGLRNRLTHGEYFNSRDHDTNIFDLLHKRIIFYFNKSILNEELLEVNVVDPQRHIWGDKEGDEIFGGRFIKAIGEKPLNLKGVLESDKNTTGDFEGYQYLYDDGMTTNF